MPFSNFVDAQKYRIPPYDISLDLTWHKQFSVSDLQKKKDYENIKQTIRKGIPDNLRGQVLIDCFVCLRCGANYSKLNSSTYMTEIIMNA
ncbi:hypothetical protein O9G_004260 [Rozella allomycis CSF55]|uniref:Uncharacterized protein n=1 Tax=Rozella allomycis (strain CSF55) TaxID=988480 RepID=A0A075B3F8_ROZAC|nr:hypothetical protein O9G_004260 [Rozella allomycis CSF55]|eukprot:EPZ36901.1 hypothetical protein O9G_004260 [Rozella allomycis CSF55]